MPEAEVQEVHHEFIGLSAADMRQKRELDTRGLREASTIDGHNIVEKLHPDIIAETSSLQMKEDGVKLSRNTHVT